MKNRQILVIGNNDNGCTPELEKMRTTLDPQ